MSEATEMLEHMEEAGHGGREEHAGGGGHGKGPGKGIGITMALLGVMLAFCAAMVGSERTELIKTMVEQSNRWGIYQSETTKLRVIEGDLEMLKALTPSKEEAAKFDEILRTKRAASGKADSEDTAELKDLIASALDDMTDVLAPDAEDIAHFKKLAHTYKRDVADAKEDAEAYEGAIRAHESAAEWYERAQLAAEIGIVIASVALLLASRAAWMLAAICGMAGAGIIGWTGYTSHAALAAASAQIEYALKHEAAIEAEEETADEAPPAKTPEPAKPAAHGLMITNPFVDAPKPSASPAPQKPAAPKQTLPRDVGY
jgi:hypothetical protein